MPYITLFLPPIYHQMTFDEMLDGTGRSYYISNETNTRTGYRKQINSRLMEEFDVGSMITQLVEFNTKYDDLFVADRENLYHRFPIPKKSGGLRWISAPHDNMMTALRELKEMFERFMPANYHTSAFAYVKGRSTIDAVKRHQSNKSKWFAKLDFHDFFGSTTLEFVFRMFSDIFPFSEIVKNQEGSSALQKALSLCFLNGGLPQGTPISPLITNIMMIPIDFYLYNKFRKFNYQSKNGKSVDRNMTYTRYADDMIISSKYGFEVTAVIEYVESVLALFNAPFQLNRKKTRYGSSAGSNWNLGLMLNKDNKITIGYRQKKHFKAMLHHYVTDKKNGVQWELQDVQHMNGMISYYKMVENDYIEHLILHYNSKFRCDIKEMIKADLKL